MNRNEAIGKLFEAGRNAFGISPIKLAGWKYDYDACHYVSSGFTITENDVFEIVDTCAQVLEVHRLLELDPAVSFNVVTERLEYLMNTSLQSRIETLLDMKFETEEKLLETIGSLWGKPEPVKTYWGGVEPIRVGHITADGEVVVVLSNGKPVYNCGDFVLTDDHPQPHPFAKYTEQEREFLQSQVEAGVIKLC